MLLVPRERAVLRGSAASYNCSISVPWVVMTWLFDGSVGLTISMEHGVLENTPRFTAVNYTTNENYKWEFTIRNVTRKDSGEIMCAVQNIQSIRANLSVQGGCIEFFFKSYIPEGNAWLAEQKQLYVTFKTNAK